MEDLTNISHLEATKEEYASFNNSQKNILDKAIIDNQTDIITYSYYHSLNIQKFNPKCEKNPRKKKIVNLYNSKVGQELF